MDESKNQYNIKEYIENLGWEENDGELSVRTSFVAKNDKTSKGYLSKIIKPGCLVGVFATDGASQDEEVARGYVETWNPVEKSGGHTLKCTCYDELYKLQKSQDNRYFPSGTGTKSAIEGIFDDWEIPQGSYQGPNASHGICQTLSSICWMMQRRKARSNALCRPGRARHLLFREEAIRRCMYSGQIIRRCSVRA